jgi:hypothetical protein
MPGRIIVPLFCDNCADEIDEGEEEYIEPVKKSQAVHVLCHVCANAFAKLEEDER